MAININNLGPNRITLAQAAPTPTFRAVPTSFIIPPFLLIQPITSPAAANSGVKPRSVAHGFACPHLHGAASRLGTERAGLALFTWFGAHPICGRIICEQVLSCSVEP